MRGKNLWAICLALLTLMGSGVPVNAAETDIGPMSRFSTS